MLASKRGRSKRDLVRVIAQVKARVVGAGG